MSNYLKFRGQCKELCDEAIANVPSLTLVRGHYYCPLLNTKNKHWWTVRQDGSIYDPSKLQFPSAGLGTYIPFDGSVECANCGVKMPEEQARFDGNYAFCSYECYGIFIGLL